MPNIVTDYFTKSFDKFGPNFEIRFGVTLKTSSNSGNIFKLIANGHGKDNPLLWLYYSKPDNVALRINTKDGIKLKNKYVTRGNPFWHTIKFSNRVFTWHVDGNEIWNFKPNVENPYIFTNAKVAFAHGGGPVSATMHYCTIVADMGEISQEGILHFLCDCF